MNLNVNIPHHRSNVKVVKHDQTASPFALSACENAYLEECDARERESRKKTRADEFQNSTRIMLLRKMQEIENEKQRGHIETVSDGG